MAEDLEHFVRAAWGLQHRSVWGGRYGAHPTKGNAKTRAVRGAGPEWSAKSAGQAAPACLGSPASACPTPPLPAALRCSATSCPDVRALDEGSCHSSEPRESHRAFIAEQLLEFGRSVQVSCFQSCAPSRGKCTRIPKFPSCAGFRVQGCCICGLLWEFGAANEACFPPAVLDAGASQTFLHKSCFVFCCFGRQRELARLLLARQPC